MLRTPIVPLVCALALAGGAIPAQAQPTGLETEGVAAPLNVHRAQPRLSWLAGVDRQVAWQVQAASSLAALEAGEPDLWDSGRVVGGNSLAQPYRGLPLQSRQDVYWRVRVWTDLAQAPGDWSTPARWEMGLLSQEDWQARWIGAPDFAPVEDAAYETYIQSAGNVQTLEGPVEDQSTQRLRAMPPAVLLRHGFTITRPVSRARLYSTAAGYLEVMIDGKPVGNHRMMGPAQTNYESRILYAADDVSAALSPGRHTIAIHLGNGWYGERIAFPKNNRDTGMFYGEPLAIAQLELTYTDGSREIIATDSDWEVAPSPIVKNGIFSGELHDARLAPKNWQTGASGQTWQRASVAESPTKALEGQLMPQVKPAREVKPERVLEPSPGVYVFDFGQNFTGIPHLDLSQAGLSRGDAVTLRYAEWADDRGKISQLSGGGWATSTNQVDGFISDGESQAWAPRFTWHGFRYVEVTGLSTKPDPSMMHASLLRTDVERVGEFRSSDPLLNRIHDLALWTYESNLISIPSDCPIRERQGWTGDAHMAVRLGNYNFDMANFWEKYLDDFRSSRFRAPAIVPGLRSLPDRFDWAAAEVFLAWEHYLHYGDPAIFADRWGRLEKFAAFAESIAQTDGLVIDHSYGDWSDPQRDPGTPRPTRGGVPIHTPPEVTTGALHVRMLDQMAAMAKLLDKFDRQAHFEALAFTARTAFDARFFDGATGGYGSQTANAMALQFDLVPAGLRETVAQALVADIRAEGGHYTVGALGQTWLYPALADTGHADTALSVFHAEGYPGFRYLMEELGGTSLWERQGSFVEEVHGEPDRSLSHPFHGGYDAWFYSGLGGIRPDPENPGFKHALLSPSFPAGLEWIESSHRSGYGTLASNWRRGPSGIEWTVTVPQNTTATIMLEGQQSNGRVLGPGVHVIAIKDDP